MKTLCLLILFVAGSAFAQCPLLVNNGFTNAIAVSYTDMVGNVPVQCVQPGGTLRTISAGHGVNVDTWATYTANGTVSAFSYSDSASTNPVVLNVWTDASGNLQASAVQFAGALAMAGYPDPTGDTFDYGAMGASSLISGFEVGGMISATLLAIYGVRYALNMVNDNDAWE